MQNQFTLEIKNLHYGFLKEGADPFIVTRGDVEITTAEILQGIVYEHQMLNGREVKMVYGIYEVEAGTKRKITQLKNIIKKKCSVELDMNVEIQYEYGGKVS